ncbi:hypothetical protein K431DRAFT_302455 [Polychaeton citri CBS 116435]|uniref:Uncharacterized protein n=1 Tax=Polychaeton citri CBS 116435 TaxID=1314669 RepID=A0A9P4UNQ4_9PEZI|nr:hypothetical protein K431DRAFT_302455 [Polychaeton citri CBS 116435]
MGQGDGGGGSNGVGLGSRAERGLSTTLPWKTPGGLSALPLLDAPAVASGSAAPSQSHLFGNGAYRVQRPPPAPPPLRKGTWDELFAGVRKKKLLEGSSSPSPSPPSSPPSDSSASSTSKARQRVGSRATI